MARRPDDTIVALASASGPAARGIVRLSGPATGEITSAMFVGEDEGDWKASRVPRRTSGRLALSGLAVPVPSALMFWPTHRSYTGQTLAEFHLTGSPPLLDAVIATACLYGARLAERGEFTLRAFLSGRITLLQAEAVLGVIEAADHVQLERALEQLGGRLSNDLRSVRGDLIGLLGDLEAGLDFVDEDIEFVSRVEISERLDRAWHTVHDLAQRARKQLPAGYRPRVVLAGLPNAGKSTLFNRLLAADRAIVSPVAGTTRDYVSAVLPLEGSLIELIDTAGWETPNDAIMQQAQSRQLEQMQAADLVLWCQGADLSTADEAMNRDGRRYAEHHAAHVLTVTTRSDLGISAQAPGKESSAGLRVSAVTGAGLDALASVLTEKLFRADGGRSELLGTTSARCRDSLDRAATALASARDAVRLQAGDELLSLDLRTALNELAVILGEVCTDDILDHIFSRFCIGK